MRGGGERERGEGGSEGREREEIEIERPSRDSDEPRLTRGTTHASPPDEAPGTATEVTQTVCAEAGRRVPS